jgi:hypothetical protein
MPFTSPTDSQSSTITELCVSELKVIMLCFFYYYFVVSVSFTFHLQFYAHRPDKHLQ